MNVHVLHQSNWMARGGGPKAKKEMLSSWLELQARVQAKELKKELARAAKQGNARPPSPRSLCVCKLSVVHYIFNNINLCKCQCMTRMERA
jgi:hypothetical protein